MRKNALVAALKVKIQRQEALITYVRRRNKRGDARHPAYEPDESRRAAIFRPKTDPIVPAKSLTIESSLGPRPSFLGGFE